MSTGKAIVILVTRRRGNEQGLEYRVARVMATEDITSQPDYPPPAPVFACQYVRETFAKSTLMFEEEHARAYAANLEQDPGFTEYNIWIYDFSKVFFPASNSRRLQRARQRARASLHTKMLDKRRQGEIALACLVRILDTQGCRRVSTDFVCSIAVYASASLGEAAQFADILTGMLSE